jgi:glycosyltransferase involved in cell wall biosynthesis
MISVIIPTYNEEKNIEKALKQFENQTIGRKNIELIVVDGGSKDGTREIARKFADRVIIQTSKGVGGARNDGVAVANNHIIATTDADTIIPPDWLERIARNFEDPRVVGTYGMTKPSDGKWHHKLFYSFLNAFELPFQNITRIHLPCGSNTAFRKKEFMEIGGYSDAQVCDDLEIGMRLRKKGKMKGDKKIVVFASTRRYEKTGLLAPNWLIFKNTLRLILGRKAGAAAYARQEYG